MDPLTLLLVALAVARLLRLAQADTIADPVRDRVLAAAYRHSDARGDWWAELLSCPWCGAWWIALAATAALARLPVEAVRWLSLPWALAYVAAALAANVEG